MSLRRRFILIVCLAVIALGAAGLAILELRAESTVARETSAFERGDAAVFALARALAANPSATQGAKADASPEARAAVQSVLAPLGSASAGYCRTDGTLLQAVTTGRADPSPAQGTDGPLGVPRDPASGLLPKDHDLIVTACRAARREQTMHARASMPLDLLILSVRAADEHLAAFTLLRLPPTRAEPRGLGWTLKIGGMGAATALLVLLAIDALLALRRGAEALRTALVLLQQDLRAEIPRPRAEELARIAVGLRAMAQNLADAHDRERGLERRLGHEQRLAGLGRVVAGVAHEVRNPLTGIKLKLDTMARRRLDERSAKDIATCLQEIARLDRVVSSLLLVARKGPIDKAELDLADLVDERLGNAEALAQARAVTLTREGEEEMSILANREGLTRVLDNLVRNAIEASPAGAEVRVRLERAAGEATIAVLDQGAGIPPDHLGELFEPFFTLKPEGTGIGLFLSRSLVQVQGGRLIYARDHDLTRFCATLPMDPPLAEAASHPGDG